MIFRVDDVPVFVVDMDALPFVLVDEDVSTLSCVLSVNEDTPSSPEKFLRFTLLITGLSDSGRLGWELE